MKKVIQTGDTYDEMYDHGGYRGVYDLSYKRSPYRPMYQAVLAELSKIGAKSVLEVGCGTGTFAEMLKKKTSIDYMGFDFSQVAIQKAIERCPELNSFFIGDALSHSSYEGDYDAVVCTEVLEHIPNDLEVIANWRRGVTCICSVPNYDSPYHERYFRSENELLCRYGSFLDIKRISRVKKPLFNDLSLKSRVKRVWWKRDNVKEVIRLMLGGEFEKYGGWFIFLGIRK